MLFETKQGDKGKVEAESSLAVKNSKYRHSLIKSGTLIGDALPKIEMGITYHLPCFVNWSLHDLLAHSLKFTGGSKVWMTSWAISQKPIIKLMQLQDDELIQELNCLLDHRVKSQCAEAWQLAQRNMTKIMLADIHAKVVVIQNEEWSVSITSTANMTNKRRIEKYVITCHKEVADFDIHWIQQLMNESNPFLA